MSDPYQALGVSPSASDDEIAQAYRKLAKKYHPDLNPGNQEAEKKMREINAAYEQIRTRKNGGASYERQPGGNPYGGSRGYGQGHNPFEDGPFAGGSGYDPFDIFNMFGGGYRQQQRQHRPNSPKMQAVHNFIQNRQYAEALRVLSEITERSAEWYYYSALAQSGTGNRVSAMNHAREAVRREPDNDEYQALLEQFESGGFEYRQTGQSYGFDMSNIGSFMMRLCMVQALCMCCQPYACQPYCGPAG